ncbi:hypothetical protein GCM10025792_26350 [Pseudonocardia tropica]
MRTDTRPGDSPSRPRWHVPGLLGAALAASAAAGTPDADQWQLDRPGLDQGSSGGPRLTGPDDSEMLGVTGGYQQGGDSPDVSHGADLGPAAQSAYRSAGGTG